MVNVLTYVAYLCFWERLRPRSGLQVTGKAFAFYLKKMSYVQRQGCKLRLPRSRAGSSADPGQASFSLSITSPSTVHMKWVVKALCVTLTEGSSDWERIWWSWWQNSLSFNGSTSGPWEQSPPHFAGIATLVKGEKLTTALPQICARVLQTATTIPLLATSVAFEEGGLEVLAQGLRQQRPFVVQLKYLQSDQRNFGESGS